MRNIILNVAVTLDGCIAGPNGEYDWCFTDQDYGLKEFTSRVDATLMGRKTFEVLLHEGQETFSGMRNYVFSKTLSPSSNKLVTIVSEDVPFFVSKLKNEDGKGVWLFGGGELIQTFLEGDLIDEMILSIHPIILGNGIPLFPKSNKRREYKMTECKTYPTGLVQVAYGR